jgi:hypothetical protein
MENEMSRYEIINIMPEIGACLKKTKSFNTEQEAIDLLEDAFKQKQIACTYKKEENGVSFKNEFGSEVARVVASSQPSWHQLGRA